MSAYPVEERTSWRRWVTPGPLMTKPIHRWYVFPHSFTAELVHGLIEEWGLGSQDYLLDPFVGAGTTVLAAREKGVPAAGYDLLPLAVLVASVKASNLDSRRLSDLARQLLKSALSEGISSYYDPPEMLPEGAAIPVQRLVPEPDPNSAPDLVRKALPGRLLETFACLLHTVDDLPASPEEKDFFRLAVLRLVPRYSRAVATGGWLKWVQKADGEETLRHALNEQINLMILDLDRSCLPSGPHWRIEQADARRLPVANGTFTAVITSPPYPNRHDYTRVFGVELMLAFLDWHGTRQLRYQSFHSHPEARPSRPIAECYRQPIALTEAVSRIRAGPIDRRIPAMLEGYFLDMYLALSEIRRVCRSGAHVAVVVGNAQYCGIPISVDELTAEVGEQAGLTCQHIKIIRYRGNSAQQMSRYGRRPQRESIVIFTCP